MGERPGKEEGRGKTGGEEDEEEARLGTGEIGTIGKEGLSKMGR